LVDLADDAAAPDAVIAPGQAHQLLGGNLALEVVGGLTFVQTY